MTPDRRLERASAWTGLAYLLVFGAGWLLVAHFMPPIPPTAGAAEVAEIFVDRQWAFILASLLIMVSTLLLMPCSAMLVLIIKKIEGELGVLTLSMIFTSATFMVLNYYAGFSFALAAFRSDRDPGLVQMAVDAGFLQFIGGIPLFIMYWVLMAYAVLVVAPRGDTTVPRWAGYACLWIAVLYIPELLVFVFKTGPFAWDGVVGFWIPAVLFIAYLVVSPVILVRFARSRVE